MTSIMPNDTEALKARLLSDADYLEKIYGPDHQIVADLREAATALDQQSARIQELEGALRLFAAHGNATSDYVEVPTQWLRAAASLLAKIGKAQERSRAATDVLDERRRQIEEEGWHENHDDGHDGGELAAAAACYALWHTPRGSEALYIHGRWKDIIDLFWGWDREWFKPSDPRRSLVKAGALILAEIERLDRASLNRGDGQ